MTSALQSGTRLGDYEVIESIGVGGMGEVYSALDVRLGRKAAIKVLPQTVASDPELLVRFEREARTLAALNHPNVATLFGFHSEGELRFLVMELVEGPTLAERIARGPMAFDEARSVFAQIARGLEAAHEKGIIHRDLKPANVKLGFGLGTSGSGGASSGPLKILDFGLAKALDPASGATDISQSPTLTLAATLRGEILGTAAYMSPEQAKGEPADRRADIWAFGVCLCEALSGRRVFEGNTAPEIMARVLERDPDLSVLPATVPAEVIRLLERCLRKDPSERIQHIADVRLALEDADGLMAQQPVSPGSSHRPGLVWLAGAAVAGLVVGAAMVFLGDFGSSAEESTPRPIRFTVGTPDGEPLGTGPIALSPDGRYLAMVSGSEARPRLLLRDLERLEPTVLSEESGIEVGMFTADSSTLGFTTNRGMYRVSVDGGGPNLIPGGRGSLGADWLDDGGVVTAGAWGSALSLLAAGESVSSPLTTLAEGEGAHLWPQILPGDRYVLFTVWTPEPSWDESKLAILDLSTGKQQIVLDRGAAARWAASGHLLFWRSDGLMAVPFDAARPSPVTSEPIRVLDGLRLNLTNGTPGFALSENGTLAYIAGKIDGFEKTEIFDLGGDRPVENLEIGTFIGDAEFSPNGRQLALTLRQEGTYNIGVWDLDREVLTQLTFARDNYSPTWSPAGDRLAFYSNRDGPYRIWAVAADGSGEPEVLFQADTRLDDDTDWSADGKTFLVESFGDLGPDISLYDFESGTTEKLLSSSAAEMDPAFSPEGDFVLWTSDETGRREVFTMPFPGGGRKYRVSSSGGWSAKWSPDGKRIYYIGDEGVWECEVSIVGSTLELGRPRLLLQVPSTKSMDISPDGRLMILGRVPLETMANEVHVVLHWFEELERLVPTGN